MWARPWRVLVACPLVLAGCAADAGVARPGEGQIADELAPSQQTADTAVPPDTPPPCDPDALEVWTAQVIVADIATAATLRVRNASSTWCEVDIGGSPGLDPAIEPTVWLDAGGWADLIVSPEPAACGRSELRRAVALDLGGDELGVPTALVGCGWRLSAFYPAEPPGGPCAELSAAVVEPFVVLRNDAGSSCELGEVVDARGEPAEDAGARVGVVAVAPGDVVAIGYDTPADALDDSPDGTVGGASGQPPCAGSAAVTIVFELAAAVVVPGLPCGAVMRPGPVQPWFGDADGPLAGLTAAPVDADAALAALDPFAGGAR